MRFPRVRRAFRELMEGVQKGRTESGQSTEKLQGGLAGFRELSRGSIVGREGGGAAGVNM